MILKGAENLTHFLFLYCLLQVFLDGSMAFLFLSSCREVDECESLEKMSHGQDLRSHLSIRDADETHKCDSHEVFTFFLLLARELKFSLTSSCLMLSYRKVHLVKLLG